MEKTVIVGTEPKGLLLGEALVRAFGPDAVRVVDNPEAMDRWETEGLRWNGEASPLVFAREAEGPADLVIFSGPAEWTEEAAALAAPWVERETVVLTLAEGVGSEELLTLRLGPDKILSGVLQDADLERTGNEVTCRAPGSLWVGVPPEDYFDREEKLAVLLDYLEKTDLTVAREEDIFHRRWLYFLKHVGPGMVSAACDANYGAMQTPGQTRETLLALMNEVRKAGACQGILVTQKEMQGILEEMAGMDPATIPAMASRTQELLQNGRLVLEAAAHSGMTTPVTEELCQTIEKKETK